MLVSYLYTALSSVVNKLQANEKVMEIEIYNSFIPYMFGRMLLTIGEKKKEW